MNKAVAVQEPDLNIIVALQLGRIKTEVQLLRNRRENAEERERVRQIVRKHLDVINDTLQKVFAESLNLRELQKMVVFLEVTRSGQGCTLCTICGMDVFLVLRAEGESTTPNILLLGRTGDAIPNSDLGLIPEECEKILRELRNKVTLTERIAYAMGWLARY